jgi:hypothetical protein
MTPIGTATPATETCRPRSIRRTRSEIESIRATIYDVLATDNPMTVRQVFYQLVSRGVIGKTEGEYHQTVIRLLGSMRRSGEIPFGWIADTTRWMRKPQTYDSLRGMLELTKETYRRALWSNQDVYVEVWLEKDALAGVLYAETAPWDVPLMVTRGYPSLSYLYEAAEAIVERDKPTFIYYFGDWDPSGRDISRATMAGLREFAPDAEINFLRMAVTEEQIEILQLPTRPTKKSDPRAKNFDGESVEVDAIPAATLRAICRASIEDHIDKHALERLRTTEEQERATLERILQSLEVAAWA